MSRNNDSLPENPRTVKEITDDYNVFEDDDKGNDQYAPPEDDDRQVYDDNNYGNEGRPSSLPSNVPNGEPSSFPTKKARTGEPTLMPTNKKQPSRAPVQIPVPTLNDIFPSSLPTIIYQNHTGNGTIVPGNNTDINHRQPRLGGGAIAGIVMAILSIPFIGYGLRLIYKKFTNSSVEPVINVIVGDDNDDAESNHREVRTGTGKVSPIQDDQVQDKQDATGSSKGFIRDGQIAITEEEPKEDKPGDQDKEDLQRSQTVDNEEKPSTSVTSGDTTTLVIENNPLTKL